LLHSFNQFSVGVVVVVVDPKNNDSSSASTPSKDGKGIGSKRKNYVSIPYETICAYSVETAGAVLDKDCSLNVWSTGYPSVSIDFATSNVDLFQIYQWLNVKVTGQELKGTPDYVDPVPPNMDKK
jgi:Bacterial PH domain